MSAPCLDIECKSATKVATENICHLQRVIASEELLSSRKKRFDCAVLLSYSYNENETKAFENWACSSSCSLWFGRTLSFLRIYISKDH